MTIPRSGSTGRISGISTRLRSSSTSNFFSPLGLSDITGYTLLERTLPPKSSPHPAFDRRRIYRNIRVQGRQDNLREIKPKHRQGAAPSARLFWASIDLTSYSALRKQMS